jgi:hypothetical protein
MGLRDWWRRLRTWDWEPERFDLDELSRRLGVSLRPLLAVEARYHEFPVAKRSGGFRTIAAPDPQLKKVQRLIHRRLLQRLPVHRCAHGFSRGRSIVTNAAAHTGKAVVVRLDIRSFFASTSAKRVRKYFRTIGWSRQAADLLVKLCTWRGALPQGAPTSPRLSNLVNYQLDTRLARLAESFHMVWRNPATGEIKDFGKTGATYTRYADDIVLSFDQDRAMVIKQMISDTRRIAGEYGYRLHRRKKMRIRRRYQCQEVTGLVVNQQVALPRRTRRWLRAVEHRVATSSEPSISREQLAGWRALQQMIETQRDQ